MFEVNDIPPIDSGALEQLIDEYAEHREFLFFRRNPGDDLDPFLGHEDGYECFCSKCRERFVRPLKEGPASHWGFCPVCHGAVTPKRWGSENAKFLAAEAFLFSFFLHGRGREVWLVSLQVRMNPHFLESKYSGREVSRIVFYEGGAKKWKFNFLDDIQPVKRIAMPRWQYGCYGGAYPSVLAINSAELRGTCLEYSCLETANYALEDLAAYLALYCRYPAAVEHLVKRGFIHWLRERESRGGALFQRLINLRADSPKKLFRGLDRADLRALLAANASLQTALFYRELRRAGAARADEDSVYFAMTASAVLCEFSEFSALCTDFGETPKEVRRYIERQARRADQTLHAALTELRDYHGQLDRLGLDGGQLPPDLHEAHARLSERERDEAVRNAENAKERADELQEQLDAIEDKPADVRELTEEELEEIREKVLAENAEAAKAAEERARAAEEKLDKVKNPAAHKVNFLFGEVRGLVERLEQALEELQQTDEAACEKFAKVIADWLRKEGDRLA